MTRTLGGKPKWTLTKHTHTSWSSQVFWFGLDRADAIPPSKKITSELGPAKLGAGDHDWSQQL